MYKVLSGIITRSVLAIWSLLLITPLWANTGGQTVIPQHLLIVTCVKNDDYYLAIDKLYFGLHRRKLARRLLFTDDNLEISQL